MAIETSNITNYSRRFINRRDKFKLIKSCDDFCMRRHGMPIIRVVSYFLVVILFSIWILNNLISSLLFLPPEQPPPMDEILQVLGIVVFAAFTAGLVAILILFKIRQNVLETEFQSLIFASGMRVNNDFCLVVHKEQTGFYCDYRFTELFSDYGEHHHDPFHRLITSEGFSDQDEEKMLKVMKSGKSAEFTFKLKKKNEKTRSMKVKIDPLEKPSDFFLIQGNYV